MEMATLFTPETLALYLRGGATTLAHDHATALTSLRFLGTAPLQASFLPIVFAQGFVATLFFG